MTTKGANECSIIVGNAPNCSHPNTIKKMMEFYFKKTGVNSKKEQIIKDMMDLLDVESESGIISNPEFSRYLGMERAEMEKQIRFNPHGPADSTKLLDNFNIDDNLKQWAMWAKKIYNKKFYHVPFQMIDFEKQRTALARISIPKLIQNGYDCAACVLNTDISSGKGIHWFCIFMDFQHDGSKKDPYVLEFFNSSGNKPTLEMQVWLDNTIIDIMKTLKKHTKILIAARRRIQYSETECGVWSLMYIKFRLMGKNPHFIETKTDKDMIKYREELFRKYK